MAIDEAKLHAFMGKVVGDMGAAMSVALTRIGERLGLYKAMAGAGPMTAAELAKKTNTTERYVREWLLAQAAGGYVTYDGKSERFTLPPEQAMALADEASPFYIHGAWDVALASLRDEQKLERAFRSGDGIAWGDHDPCLFCGTERFFRPGYNANLASQWIPALGDVEPKLKSGAAVADVGCGHGASTIVMAKAFPKSKFYGFDYHAPSIECARKAAEKAGVSGNCTFAVASAGDFPAPPGAGANGSGGYDLVAFFDCLHDMGDPVGAARQVHRRLKKDGAWLIVEPFADDRPEQNLNPIGRVYYAASTSFCVPNSLAAKGPALGAQAGEAKLKAVVKEGGFTKFRRATQTPFNLVLEARP